jgi:hypothetical protein
MYVVPDLRQTDNTNDRYNSNSASGSYSYQKLGNSSLSVSEGSLNTSEDHYPHPNSYLNSESGSRIIKSNSDQQIPENFKPSSFVYVNKNGLVSEFLSSPSKQSQTTQNSTKLLPRNEMVCNAFLVELAKSNSASDGDYKQFKENYQSLKDFGGRPIPIPGMGYDDLNQTSSDSSNNNSLVCQQINGGVRINTSVAIGEPSIEITYDHVKYINIFSILCCWCFPLTGILSVIYARMTAKYYNMRDLNKAKKYLKRSEGLLIATFFFGFTLIAIGFACLQHYFFSDVKYRSVYNSNRGLNFGGAGSFAFFAPK